MALLREQLDAEGVLPILALREVEDGLRVRAAGVITHRQRPETAGNVTFLSVEDESGILNVICSPGFWARHRAVLRTSRSVVLRGTVENASGAVNLLADGVTALHLPAAGRSRDFR